MMLQGNEYRRRKRPSRWRWLPALVIGILLFAYMILDLLPRFAGGLLGRDRDQPGGWSGDDWQATEIIWDPGEPEPHTEEVETATENEPATEPELVPDADTSKPAFEPEQRNSDGAAAAAGKPGPADAPSTGSPGEGPHLREGRRSPRILSQAWVRQDLMAGLDRSGSFRFRLRVEADGRVSRWELVSGFDCETCLAEAERIIRSLRFAPGTLSGRPVACWVPYKIEFRAGRNR